MTYNKRVRWTVEEEEILMNALNKRIETGKNIDLELVCSLLESLHEKYTTNPKIVGNKLVSLKNAPTKYNPRTKWSEEEEDILIEAIKESLKNNTFIRYSAIVVKNKDLEEKYKSNPQLLKNKVVSLKIKLKTFT